MTDTERLDWLENQSGCALLSDDNGHWAVTWDGMQQVPEGDGPVDLDTTFYVLGEQWSSTVRMAVDRAMLEAGENMP